MKNQYRFVTMLFGDLQVENQVAYLGFIFRTHFLLFLCPSNPNPPGTTAFKCSLGKFLQFAQYRVTVPRKEHHGFCLKVTFKR